MAASLAGGVLATACVLGEPFDPDAQALTVAGQLLESDGVTPRAGQVIDHYTLTFVVDGGFEIERTFVHDEAGAPLVTDTSGHFALSATDLALSYDWQRDEYVCEDVCTLWAEDCYLVTEPVCVDECEIVTYDACYESCWDECSTTCYDETVCETYYDEYGPYEVCWTETYCDDDCTTYCDTWCEPVTEQVCTSVCHDETYERCDDICLETESVCEWVTRTYTSYPSLQDVDRTEARVRVRGTGGAPLTLTGDPLEARQAEACTRREDGTTRCVARNEWRQNDVFVLP